MDHLVSVIIPFYNEEKYIETSVQNIIGQTHKNLEILLINDASTDSSLEKISKLSDSRIKVISLKNNVGRPAARNIGIEAATGDFITLMDADDECSPKRISKQLDAIIKNGANTVSGTWIKIIAGDIEKIKALPASNDEIIKGFIRKFNRVTFVAGTMMASSSIFKEFKYRTKFKYFEDWDLLLRLYESGKVNFVNVPELLYTYCIRSKSSRVETDWYDYNVFARNCQLRRLIGESEFDSLEKFNSYLKDNSFEALYYKSLKIMIRVKRRIENY